MKILMSGGSGLLGAALQLINPKIIAPPRTEMDIADTKSIDIAIKKYKPDVFLHAAAFTSPPKCNKDPLLAVTTNIMGTCNVVLSTAKHKVKLIYVSTDYVFKGDKGMYKEEDEVYPQNIYAWTKLGGECAVRAYDNSLIIRTSFCPNVFPYEAAFIDQYTSRDKVSVISELINKIILRELRGVIHVGTERKTIKDLALKLGKKDVADLHRNEVDFDTPEDTSLNTSKLIDLVNE